jgi:hypothetical protein
MDVAEVGANGSTAGTLRACNGAMASNASLAVPLRAVYAAQINTRQSTMPSKRDFGVACARRGLIV